MPEPVFKTVAPSGKNRLIPDRTEAFNRFRSLTPRGIVFCDVDNTLVLWKNGKHPWMDGFEDAYDLNKPLMRELDLAARAGWGIVVWSGGGGVWAQIWRERLLSGISGVFAGAKTPGWVTYDDIVIDDLPSHYDWMRMVLPPPVGVDPDGATGVDDLMQVFAPDDFSWTERTQR